MLFNSLEFLLFFPIVTAMYFALPTVRARQILLVVASTIFYMAFIPAYAIILYATIVVDYFAGLQIARSEGRQRTAWLVVSLIANIGCLAVFKYCNFLIDNANVLLGAASSMKHIPLLTITLPVGLSFHTFQAMSYTIEVYRGRQPAERSFLVYSLYVMFYPQLVAGPIERPQNVIHQFKVLHRFDAERATSGLRLILWGFFKKAVIADRLAVIVSAVYGAPSHHSGPILLLATFAFAIQIYADFSGYSDIALGTARFMGIELMVNFRQPYAAQSISEFWSRWHISLSTWFRDYLYIPLGGNRAGPVRRRFNLLATFVVSGLWHGANWTYVIWGGLNGVLLVAESFLFAHARDRKQGIAGVARIAVTFALICLTWIFFRATSVGDAWLIVTRLPAGLGAWAHPASILDELSKLATGRKQLLITLTAVAALLVVDACASRKATHAAELLAKIPSVPRWGVYASVGFALAIFGIYGRQQFIYFQF